MLKTSNVQHLLTNKYIVCTCIIHIKLQILLQYNTHATRYIGEAEVVVKC